MKQFTSKMGLNHTFPTIFRTFLDEQFMQDRSEEDHRSSQGLPDYQTEHHLIFFLCGLLRTRSTEHQYLIWKTYKKQFYAAVNDVIPLIKS